MDKLSKAIQVLEDQINYSVRNMDEVVVELDFESADVILELLKEKQPRKPHYTTLQYIVEGKDVSVKHPECPKCVENRLFLWDAEIEKGQAFCKRCGQAIDWKDGEQE